MTLRLFAAFYSFFLAVDVKHRDILKIKKKGTGKQLILRDWKEFIPLRAFKRPSKIPIFQLFKFSYVSPKKLNRSAIAPAVSLYPMFQTKIIVNQQSSMAAG